VVRDPDLLDRFSGQRMEGKIRDWFFLFYQVNAIFAMGLVGGPLVLWFTYRAWRRPPPHKPKSRSKRDARKAPQISPPVSPEQRFWQILIAAGVLLGVAVVGERDPLGVGHLTLLSLQIVGLTMLAAVVPWRRGILTMLILAGCAVDFSFGVWLQAHVEALDNSAQATVFPGLEFRNGAIGVAEPGPDALSGSAWNNWYTKHRLAVFDRWLDDLNRQHGNDPQFQAALPGFRGQMEKARAEDAKKWQGWFTNHGGEVILLGDHVAAWSAAFQALLVALFLGLAGSVYRLAT
jgi:hypothetical protein